MNKRFTILVLTAAFAVGSASTPASAQLAKDVSKCRSATAKALAKLAATTGKAVNACHADRNDADIADTVDCNDVDSIGGKDLEKVQGAQTKLADAITGKCEESVVDPTDIFESYISCPEPCATETGLTDPMQDFDDISECLQCVGVRFVEAAAEEAMGLPTIPMGGLSDENQDCMKALSSNFQKLLNTIVKEGNACQKSVDGGKIEGETPGDVAACTGADPKQKVEDALDAAEAAVLADCASATLGTLDACASTTAADLSTCATAAYQGGGLDLFPYGFQAAPDHCPTILTTTIFAGTSDHHDPTDTVLSVGWSGLAHGIDIVDSYTNSLDVDCSGTLGACGTCTVTGPSALDPQYEAFTRCIVDPSVPCTTPFENDAACGGQECGYFLGTPLPISAGNTPTCTLNRVAEPFTGTVNPETGEAELNLNLRSKVHLGLGQNQPCPVCKGTCNANASHACFNDDDCINADDGPCDLGTKTCTVSGFECKNDADCIDTDGPCNLDAPMDGSKDGVCVGGPEDGNDCDIHAFDASFGDLSMDCPPDGTANFSGDGLQIALPLSTGHSELPFENACDSPNQTKMCACGVCSGDVAGVTPCHNDQDCIDLGLGTCTSVGAGVSRNPNACNAACSGDSGVACEDDQDCIDLTLGTCLDPECTGDPETSGRGSCSAGPFDMFCDGFTRANGDGFLACSTDGACSPMSLGFDAGQCTLVRARRCFIDPIEADGIPDTGSCEGSGDACESRTQCPLGELCVAEPYLVSHFCLPPTSNPAINTVSGTPGPGQVLVQAKTELRHK